MQERGDILETEEAEGEHFLNFLFLSFSPAGARSPSFSWSLPVSVILSPQSSYRLWNKTGRKVDRKTFTRAEFGNKLARRKMRKQEGMTTTCSSPMISPLKSILAVGILILSLTTLSAEGNPHFFLSFHHFNPKLSRHLIPFELSSSFFLITNSKN